MKTLQNTGAVSYSFLKLPLRVIVTEQTSVPCLSLLLDATCLAARLLQTISLLSAIPVRSFFALARYLTVIPIEIRRQASGVETSVIIPAAISARLLIGDSVHGPEIIVYLASILDQDP